MSLTLIFWFVLFVGYGLAALFRPAYALPVYFLTFFAHPAWWWWGRAGGPEIFYGRWSFYAGMTLLLSLLICGCLPQKEPNPMHRRVLIILALTIINAIFVHYTLAGQAPMAGAADKPFKLVLKFSLLFVLTVAAIRNQRDYQIAIWALVLGAGYWGWEVWYNDRGVMRAGRLEGLGGPGATDANHMASVLVTILPLCGGMVFAGKYVAKFFAGAVAVLLTNTILLCNSRGAFLSVILSAVVLLTTARGKLRKKAFIGVALGSICAFMLMGDPEILERFMSTFAGSEERDTSASSRIMFWTAGFNMLGDWPFGAGGDGFKRAGGDYMHKSQVAAGRSVHNGFINEMCEWGYQGFTLRMAFLLTACWACYKTMDYQRQPGGDENMAFFGSCTLAATAGFMGTCMFGDYFDNEWGYWMAAMCYAYARNYNAPMPKRRSWTEALLQRKEKAEQMSGYAEQEV